MPRSRSLTFQIPTCFMACYVLLLLTIARRYEQSPETSLPAFPFHQDKFKSIAQITSYQTSDPESPMAGCSPQLSIAEMFEPMKCGDISLKGGLTRAKPHFEAPGKNCLLTLGYNIGFMGPLNLLLKEREKHSQNFSFQAVINRKHFDGFTPPSDGSRLKNETSREQL